MTQHTDAGRRRVLATAARSAAVAGLMPACALAQPYPSRPIRLLVPVSAGGGTDMIARVVADQLSRGMRQPWVVENQGGAGGQIASQATARAEPDGYNLMIGYVSTHGTLPAVRKVPYDPVGDFTHIAMIGGAPNVLVAQSAGPASSLPYTGQMPGWTHRLRDAGVDVTSIGKLHFRNETDDTGFTRQILPMHVVNGVGDLLGAVRDPLPVRHKTRALAEEIGIGESSYTRYDRAIAQASTQWIREHAQDDGWVLFASFVAPHFPLIAPEEFASGYRLADIPLPKLARAADRADHPWIAALRTCFPHDSFFDDELRRRALLSYGGLCSFMDWHFAQICRAIDESGLADEALVIYTSDHGDNMGARALWGKSTLYEEAARVPMLLRAPGHATRKVVGTHVSLVDVGATLLAWMGIQAPVDLPGRSLVELAQAPDDPARPVFSEYHAAGAATGAYMLRQDRWKLIYYVDMAPQLFDLVADPEERTDLVPGGRHAHVVDDLIASLRRIVDPEAQDRVAKADQHALIEAHGGREAVVRRGGFGATPAPGVEAKFA